MTTNIQSFQSLEGGPPRGLGTDIAVVGSMVFLAQFVLSISMATIIDLLGTNSVTIFMASILSVASACLATQVDYADH